MNKNLKPFDLSKNVKKWIKEEIKKEFSKELKSTAKKIIAKSGIPYAHYKNSDMLNKKLPKNNLTEFERNELFNVVGGE